MILLQLRNLHPEGHLQLVPVGDSGGFQNSPLRVTALLTRSNECVLPPRGTVVHFRLLVLFLIILPLTILNHV